MAGVSGMATKGKDRITRRLTAIKTASAAQFDGPEAARPSRNKRSEERRTVYRFARLVLPDRSVVKCIMKDVSTGGAKIVIEGNIAMPSRVLLKVDQTGQTKRARVAWQNETEVGLQFIVEPGAEQQS